MSVPVDEQGEVFGSRLVDGDAEQSEAFDGGFVGGLVDGDAEQREAFNGGLVDGDQRDFADDEKAEQLDSVVAEEETDNLAAESYRGVRGDEVFGDDANLVAATQDLDVSVESADSGVEDNGKLSAPGRSDKQERGTFNLNLFGLHSALVLTLLR